MTRKILLTLVLLLAVGGLRGDDLIIIEEPDLGGVVLGEIAHNGTGCDLGSVYSSLDTSTQELLIFMDDYYVEAGGDTRIARKNCSLSIPVLLPPGIQVALVTTRYEGFNILPEGASTVLNSEAFIAGTVGEQTSERFDGELDEDFVVESTSAVGDEAVSECGGAINLRINSSLRLKTNTYGDSALAAITALGLGASPLVQKLKFTRCDF